MLAFHLDPYDQEDDKNQEADHLRSPEGSKHQTVRAKLLYKKAFDGIQNAISPKCPAVIPASIVDHYEYEEHQQAPQGFIEEGGVHHLAIH